MTAEQKIAQLEDEFETVKQLLASAASFAESSSRKVDRLAESQARTDEALRAYIAEGREQQTRLEQAQARTDQCLESFIFEVQRLIDTLGGRIEPLTGNLDRLEGIVFGSERESSRCRTPSGN